MDGANIFGVAVGVSVMIVLIWLSVRSEKKMKEEKKKRRKKAKCIICGCHLPEWLYSGDVALYSDDIGDYCEGCWNRIKLLP